MTVLLRRPIAHCCTRHDNKRPTQPAPSWEQQRRESEGWGKTVLKNCPSPFEGHPSNLNPQPQTPNPHFHSSMFSSKLTLLSNASLTILSPLPRCSGQRNASLSGANSPKTRANEDTRLFFTHTHFPSFANCVPRHTSPLRLVAVGPDHLSRGRRSTVAPRNTTLFQEGQSECPCRCARQQSLPPSQPPGLDHFPEVLWLVPHLGVRHRVEEREGLARARAADFAGHHHQACPTVTLSKFGVGALFPNAGLGHAWQPHLWLRIAGAEIRPGALWTPSWCRSQAESICHHLQSAIVGSGSGWQVQILDAHVPSHSLPGLSAHACCRALHGKTPACGQAAEATWIEWTATPAT